MKEKGASDQVRPDQEEVLQSNELSVTGDAGGSHDEKLGRWDLPIVAKSKRREIDLNKEAEDVVGNDDPENADNLEDLPLSGKGDRVNDDNCMAPGGLGLDSNVDGVSCSENQDLCDANENSDHVKIVKISEDGSATGAFEERESTRIWKEMKQNGFFSSIYSGIPLPEPEHGEKKAMINMNKKTGQKVQVEDIKTAAPSGLLNGLKPAILTHERNRKQVRSFIEAILRSVGLEDGQPGTKQTSRLDDGDKDFVKMANCGTQSNLVHGDDRPELQLPSLNKGSLSISSLSGEESPKLAGFSSLSVKGATVALEWLELLLRDIRRRLAALRQSRRKVCAVIITELPLLVSEEFPSNQEKDGYVHKSTGDRFSSSSYAEIHQAKWSALFRQMHESLSEQERELEILRNQIASIQRHCKDGLNKLPSQQLGISTGDSRTTNRSEYELAVTAAAASIYSICNFISSKENRKVYFVD